MEPQFAVRVLPEGIEYMGEFVLRDALVVSEMDRLTTSVPSSTLWDRGIRIDPSMVYFTALVTRSRAANVRASLPPVTSLACTA